MLTNGTVTINGVEYNKDSVDGIDAIKKELIRKFHNLGIMITENAFNHMLLSLFGDAGAEGLRNCLNGTSVSDNVQVQSIDSFVSYLNSAVDSNGSINQRVISTGFAKLGFIKQLGNWQGAYNRITVQNMALGLDGK